MLVGKQSNMRLSYSSCCFCCHLHCFAKTLPGVYLCVCCVVLLSGRRQAQSIQCMCVGYGCSRLLGKLKSIPPHEQRSPHSLALALGKKLTPACTRQNQVLLTPEPSLACFCFVGQSLWVCCKQSKTTYMSLESLLTHVCEWKWRRPSLCSCLSLEGHFLVLVQCLYHGRSQASSTVWHVGLASQKRASRYWQLALLVSQASLYNSPQQSIGDVVSVRTRLVWAPPWSNTLG